MGKKLYGSPMTLLDAAQLERATAEELDAEFTQQLSGALIRPEPPRALVEALLRAGFTPDEGKGLRLFGMNCPNFLPDLYALIVPEDIAEIVANSSEWHERISVAVLQAIAAPGRIGQSRPFLALIIYGDSPPVGRLPNLPALVASVGLDDSRFRALWKILRRRTGVGERQRVSLNTVDIVVTDVAFPVAFNRIPIASESTSDTFKATIAKLKNKYSQPLKT